MDNYKPTSPINKKDPVENKKIEKVVSSAAKTKKKSDIRKFTDVFISEDVSSVKSYIFTDVFVPTIKDLISTVVKDTVDIVLFGGSRRGGTRTTGSKISYRDYYDNRHDRHSEPKARTRFDYDEIIFATKGDAEAVLDQMCAVIDQYGWVTVLDMYDAADLTAPYTANKFGWTNLNTAETVRLRDGNYVIKLPKAMPIER